MLYSKVKVVFIKYFGWKRVVIFYQYDLEFFFLVSFYIVFLNKYFREKIQEGKVNCWLRSNFLR